MRTRQGGRPYPRDAERRILVRTELAKCDMTVSDLAARLGMHQGSLSEIINGTRLSSRTEGRIAAYFGKERAELFPPRTPAELAAMREAQGASESGPDAEAGDPFGGAA